MHTIGQMAGRKVVDRMDLDLSKIRENIESALSTFDLLTFSKLVSELERKKGETEKLRGLITQLVTPAAAILAKAQKDGLESSEEVDRLFHDLEIALKSVAAVTDWIDNKIARAWQ
jgi:hypothetical protein